MLEGVHNQLGDNLKQSILVGATHHDAGGAPKSSLPGPKPAFFFAPKWIAQRAEAFGGMLGFGAKVRSFRYVHLIGRAQVVDAWYPFIEHSKGWLQLNHVNGADAMQAGYLDVLNGKLGPNQGTIMSFDSDASSKL